MTRLLSSTHTGTIYAQVGPLTDLSSSRDYRVSGAPSLVAGILPGARRRRAHPGHLRFQRQVFWQAPAFLLSLWASGRPDSPFSPCGRRGMRGKRAPQRSGRHCGTTAFLALLLWLQASRRVRAGGARTQGISASSGRFFDKPLRTISRFSHQDPQTPLSPRVGEGGMRGKRTLQRSSRHRGTTAFLALLLWLQASRRVRAGGARTQGISASSGRFFGKPLHFFSRFGLQDLPTPPSPRVREGGRGMRGKVSRNEPARADGLRLAEPRGSAPRREGEYGFYSPTPQTGGIPDDLV